MTNQPPLVSVIIPTFNRERDIQAAVFSSLKQTHHNIEVIVVDDASNDETAKKVENITDPRVRLVHHLENKGVSSARNTGIDKASGAYIAFLDSDDHWLPEKLETQLHILNCMPSAQAVTCSYVYAHRNGAKEVKTTSPSCRDIIEHGPHVANVGSCLLIRKQALSNVGEFNCSMNYNEDYEWLLRFISAFPSGMAGVVAPLVVRAGSGIYPPSQRFASVGQLRVLASQIRTQFGLCAYRSFMARQNLETALAHHQSGNHLGSMSFLLRSLVCSTKPAAYFLRRLLFHQTAPKPTFPRQQNLPSSKNGPDVGMRSVLN